MDATWKVVSKRQHCRRLETLCLNVQGPVAGVMLAMSGVLSTQMPEDRRQSATLHGLFQNGRLCGAQRLLGSGGASSGATLKVQSTPLREEATVRKEGQPPGLSLAQRHKRGWPS